MSPANQRITVIGAGLAGPLLSLYLAKRGLAVDVYERRPDLRKTEISAGRSINLALSTRGIHALKDVRLHDEIMKIAIPMRGRMMHALDGELTFQPYGKDETEVIYSISRAALNIALLNAAERHHNVSLHFNERCIGMDLRTGEVHLHNEERNTEFTIHPECAIAADGSGSAIRTEMLKLSRFDFTQTHLEYGYKELTIPAGAAGEFRMENHALHIWPRKTFMLIALPNIDGSFTCIFFFPFEGDESFETLNTQEKIVNFFRTQFPDANTLMPQFLEEYSSNPTGSMITIHCFPWRVEGKALLLGDAAHAIVPFFGQGMNCAFEDCTVLDDCIERLGSGWANVFADFERIRKPNTDAIATLAIENFVEMRDRVANPKFLLRKKVELELERRFPNIFIPKYSMVSFHRIPYEVALSRGRVQETILRELCSSIESVDQVDWQKAEKLIGNELGRENIFGLASS